MAATLTPERVSPQRFLARGQFYARLEMLYEREASGVPYNEFRFEIVGLEAWQAARRLVNAIYVLTRLSKVSGDFRLCSQVQAAAVSIMSNTLAREVA